MLRKVTKEDCEAIYNLGSKYDLKFRNKYNLELYTNSKVYLLFVDEENDIIKGFIICTIMAKVIEILLIYVDEKYRHQGIGTNLLKSIEEGNNEILLEVSKENTNALNLYQKSGYHVITTRKGYYNGVDALVMKKVLK